jgi:hypothetical protein
VAVGACIVSSSWRRHSQDRAGTVWRRRGPGRNHATIARGGHRAPVDSSAEEPGTRHLSRGLGQAHWRRRVSREASAVVSGRVRSTRVRESAAPSAGPAAGPGPRAEFART